MRLFVFLYIIGISLMANAQHELASVTYDVRFNQKFDQGGSDIRQYHAQLKVFNATSTDFYMLPDKKVSSTESLIEVNQDTLWRVRMDLDKQELFFDDLFNEKLVPRWYADSLFPMRWRIGNESTIIDSIVCTRAETRFRGRNYLAWFTYSIALPFGPWKLGGLPGLIVKIQDENEDLVMTLSSFNQKKGSLKLQLFPSQSYAEYIRAGLSLRKMMKQSAQTSDWIDCMTKIKFNSWEKVFEE